MAQTKARAPDAGAETFPVDCTPDALDRVRADLSGRIKRSIEECGFSAYQPGDLSGLVNDLMAMNSLRPIKEGLSLSSTRHVSDEEKRADLQRAAKAHDREERRAIASSDI